MVSVLSVLTNGAVRSPKDKKGCYAVRKTLCDSWDTRFCRTCARRERLVTRGRVRVWTWRRSTVRSCCYVLGPVQMTVKEHTSWRLSSRQACRPTTWILTSGRRSSPWTLEKWSTKTTTRTSLLWRIRSEERQVQSTLLIRCVMGRTSRGHGRKPTAKVRQGSGKGTGPMFGSCSACAGNHFSGRWQKWWEDDGVFQLWRRSGTKRCSVLRARDSVWEGRWRTRWRGESVEGASGSRVASIVKGVGVYLPNSQSNWMSYFDSGQEDQTVKLVGARYCSKSYAQYPRKDVRTGERGVEVDSVKCGREGRMNFRKRERDRRGHRRSRVSVDFRSIIFHQGRDVNCEWELPSEHCQELLGIRDIEHGNIKKKQFEARGHVKDCFQDAGPCFKESQGRRKRRSRSAWFCRLM